MKLRFEVTKRLSWVRAGILLIAIAAASSLTLAAPQQPAGLTATALSWNQVRATWSDVPTEDGFVLKRATASAGPWTQIATPGAGILTYTDSSVLGGTTYYYQVLAKDKQGSLSSPSATATVTTPVGLPAAPTALAATGASPSQINLTWSDNATNETSYVIERGSTSTGPFTQLASIAAGSTSYANSGLVAATTYYYRVRASNSAGSSAYSNVASATTPSGPPAAPTGLTATAQYWYQIYIQWVDNATAETGYVVERASSSAGPWTQIGTTDVDYFFYSNNGLSGGTTYYYRVKAINTSGSSAYSNVASATTPVGPPSVPTNLAGTAVSSTQINLTWTDTSNNESGFKVERWTGTAWLLLATLGQNATSYSATGLTASTSYIFHVIAYNATGTAVSSNLTVATLAASPTAPAAPSGLTATALSWSQVSLAWTDNSNNETGFELERASASTGPWVQIALVTTAGYTDTMLSSSTTYYYRVRATNTAGDSANSNTATVTTPVNNTLQAPAAPTGAIATAISASQITVTWTDASTNETGFKVERGTSTSGPWTQIGVTAGTTFSDSGLAAATAYSYRVRSYNAGGDSTYTNVATATTFAALPAAPTSLTATTASTTQINLTWVDNATNETGFKVERAATTSGPWTQIGTTAGTTFADAGLTASSSYSYRVRSYNAGGDSAYSNTATATTQGAAPAAPTSLTATSASSSQINLGWVDNATNETGFKVERAASTSGPWTQIGVTAAGATTFADSGLTSGTSYSYRVRSTNGSGDSAYTNTATATTGATASVPNAPTSLSGLGASSTIVNLSWTDTASNETGFKIERATSSSGPFSQIAALGANVQGYSDTALNPSTTYYYRIRAYNTTGDSAYSNTASASTPAATTTDGAHVWSTRFGGQYGGLDYANTQSVASDASGNVVVAGYFLGTMDFGGGITINNGGGNDAFVAKYNSAGVIQWAKRLGGASSDIAYGVDVDNAGDVIVTGSFQNTADFGCGTLTNPVGGGSNVFVVKLKAGTGACSWSKSFGGTLGDTGYAIAVDKSDGLNSIVVTGGMAGVGDFGNGITLNAIDVTSTMPDIFVMKLSSTGATQWAKGGIGSTAADRGRAVTVDHSGNILVTGEYLIAADFGAPTTPLTTGFYPDIFVVKYSPAGAPIWAKGFGSDLDQSGSDIQVDSSNNIYLAGWYRNTLTFGCPTGAMSAAVGSSGTYVASLDTNGACLWQRGILDTDLHRDPKLALDASNNVFLVGEAQAAVNGGGATLNPVTTNQKDAIVFKYTRAGGYLWGKRFAGTSTSRATGATTIGGDLVFSGTIYGTESFGGSSLVNGTNNAAVGVGVRLGP